MEIAEPASQDGGSVAIASTDDGRVLIDLMPRANPLRRCPPGRPGEIVVCATDQDEFRYKREFDVEARPAIPDARISLGDGKTLSAETEQVGVGGFPSNRIMLRLRVGF
ncbi:hypothetical protein J4558_12075 [Leptolyngbya sp. 15MV]|nr:hypothetical protein J4558_12075 [Leptolyngbya sp. 15MV]